MIEVVGVSFKKGGKIYYFSPNNLKLNKNTNVIVKTERGLQFGVVENENMEIDAKNLKSSLSQVDRVCTKRDKEMHEKNINDAKMALKKCKELVEKHGLNMIILDANYTFDKSQLLFTFLADNRIDFRKLAKDLAAIYKTRIELRQVGVRDKAKEIGGYGTCGRTLCCSKFLCDFDSVSINMAKNQGLALNPSKINGSCGRLLCCLAYEDEVYSIYKKGMPKLNQKIKIKDIEGKVCELNILKRTYKIKTEDNMIIEMDCANESN